MDDLTEARLRDLATEDKLKFIANTPGQAVANSRDLARVGLLLLGDIQLLRELLIPFVDCTVTDVHYHKAKDWLENGRR